MAHILHAPLPIWSARVWNHDAPERRYILLEYPELANYFASHRAYAPITSITMIESFEVLEATTLPIFYFTRLSKQIICASLHTTSNPQKTCLTRERWMALRYKQSTSSFIYMYTFELCLSFDAFEAGHNLPGGLFEFAAGEDDASRLDELQSRSDVQPQP